MPVAKRDRPSKTSKHQSRKARLLSRRPTLEPKPLPNQPSQKSIRMRVSEDTQRHHFPLTACIRPRQPPDCPGFLAVVTVKGRVSSPFVHPQRLCPRPHRPVARAPSLDSTRRNIQIERDFYLAETACSFFGDPGLAAWRYIHVYIHIYSISRSTHLCSRALESTTAPQCKT